MTWEAAVERLSDANLQALSRDAELGELKLTPFLPRLARIRVLLEAADAQAHLGNLPASLVRDITAQISDLSVLLDEMRAFTITQGDAAAARANMDARLDRLAEWFLERVTPFVRADVVDATPIIEAARQSAAHADEAQHAAKVTAAELAGLLESLRQQSGSVGAGNLSGAYNAQAKNHDKTAGIFFIGLAVSVVGTLLLGLYLLYWEPITVQVAGEQGWIDYARALVPRLFLIGVAAYAANFCSRNYRIHKHLQTVYEQKRSALDTYPLFAAATSEPSAKDAALLEVLRTTLGTTDTGFVNAADKTVVEPPPGAISLVQRPPST